MLSLQLPALASLLLATLAPAGGQKAPMPQRAEPMDGVGLYDLVANYTTLRRRWSSAQSVRSFHLGASPLAFGLHMPVCGDWDGDGWDSVGLYETGTGEFALTDVNQSGDPEQVIPFNTPGTYPVTGDWDGDGIDTIGSYAPGSGTFRLRNSNSSGPPSLQFAFGPYLTSIPIAGDFDGDGVETIGVYSFDLGTFYLRNTNQPGTPDHVVRLGPVNSYPVIDDWNGDGIDTVGVFDLSTETFLLRDSNTTGPADHLVSSDQPGRLVWPLAGVFTGKGKLDEHTGYPWPTATPQSQGMNPALLNQAVATASGVPAFHSLLVLKNGKLVKEAYFNDWNGTRANCIKSVSKSFLSALFGQALEQGLLTSTQQTVRSLLPEYFVGNTDPRKNLITLDHLFTMRAGLHWPGETVTEWVQAADWVDWVIDQPMENTPGSVFDYSTGLTHTGSAILTRVTAGSTWDFARPNLFEPLGIDAVRWDHDPQQIDFGGSEMFMRPRDMARLGELYRNGGALDGNQIVPAQWVEDSTAPRVPLGGNQSYGYWWWRDRFAGQDSFFAWGYGGQFVFVFAEKNMVVVTTSEWNTPQADAGIQYELIFSLLRDYIVPAAG